MWQAIALSFGLAMDAAAVSAARGLARRRGELAILPVLFGAFQSGMAALGWLGGRLAGPYIARWDHWVAFALLTLIGAKMIYEALRGGDDDDRPPGIALYVGLALATSIDAAAAGLTLPLVPIAPWLALLLIGGITAGCSFVGYLLGRRLGTRFGTRVEILGGLVLIGMGIHLLIDGL